ncbi:hypothetical protein HNQ80_003619 [Anaerosolibacter carboniphilus]|uniref:Uncharacterized protein n=1 Tax=Anaerosolibacter carboniphilus TaxID=1417629 RepID=A0A841KYV0_9FIRM|nr:hypothetical protein [Anaerosolibacter carboniphilus]MBB6217498.1 hypothetical protein [Anaerosolibacter carboniphilus]
MKNSTITDDKDKERQKELFSFTNNAETVFFSAKRMLNIMYGPQIKGGEVNQKKTAINRTKNVIAHSNYANYTFQKVLIDNYGKAEEKLKLRQIVENEGEVTKIFKKIKQMQSQVNKFDVRRLLSSAKKTQKRRIVNNIKEAKDIVSSIISENKNLTKGITDIHDQRDQLKVIEKGGVLGQFKLVAKGAFKKEAWSNAFHSKIDSFKPKNIMDGFNLKKVSKSLNLVDDTTRVGKLLPKLKIIGNALGPLSIVANMHTIMDPNESAFKKVLAGIDLVGDFTPLSPITSLANTVLPAIYDGLSSDAREDIGKFAVHIKDSMANFSKSFLKHASPMAEIQDFKNSKGSLEKLQAIENLTRKFTPASLGISAGKALFDSIGEKNKEKISSSITTIGNYTKSMISSITNTAKQGVKEVFKKALTVETNSNVRALNKRIPLYDLDRKNYTYNKNSNANTKDTSAIGPIKTKTSEELIREIVPRLKESLSNMSLAAL